ncbi:MAG: hypothetical protein O3A84_07875, partial [Proteobacteria bacterium]|nr:hypothetical protein [Pseudomonadota bacterium]
MPVVLIDPARRYTTINHDQWCAIGKFDPVLEGSREIRDTTELLESVLPQAIEQWMQIGNQMSREPSSILAHTPACAMNNTDFGIMLAWSILVQHWISESRTTLVLCRDPWLFRHLAGHPGISAGKAPSLWPTLIRLWLRGFAARFKTCLKMAVEHIRRRSTRSQFPTAARVLLVYGHPQSDATGNDGYFGNLLNDFPELVRLTHVDCSATRNNELAADGRTFSLHAWGGLSGIVGLLFAKWRPSEGLRNGPLGWLVQRAASVEGSTGQGAMLSWQIHCQKNWMGSCFPRVVAWPWENHSWERELVRVASKLKVSTIGYQHATIGRWEVNYKIASNPDGLLSIPE